MSAAGRGNETIRVLRRAELMLPDRFLTADLTIQKTKILGVAPAGEGVGDEIWELEGRRVAPGLIDGHCHGGWGVDFSRAAETEIHEVGERFVSHGVTHLLITLVPAPWEEMLESIRRAARVSAASFVFLGIHLEGPFLAPDRLGALPGSGVCPYSAERMDAILEAAAGELRVMTFAPEVLPSEQISRIQNQGVLLSVGHTSCDARACEAALAAGARRATHICNAMTPFHHREPGPVLPLLLDPRAKVEVIADGHHLDDRTLGLVLRTKGEDQVIAVSDAMPLAGVGPCQGEFAGGAVSSDGERAVREDGTLAGSVMHLPEAVHRLSRALEIPLPRAWRLGSTAPASDLRLPRLGRVQSGNRADLVILDGEDRAEITLFAGERVGRGEGEDFLPPALKRVR